MFQFLKKYYYNSQVIFALFGIALICGCENDINTIYSLSQVDSLPFDYTKGLEAYYSDSGKIQAYLESPLMKKTDEDDDSFFEFPEGFKIIFFDSLDKPESQITAKYGISYEKKNIMEAKNNVVVNNIQKNEFLETEHLIWDRNKGIIYTDVFVKITRDDEVIYGDGMTSDQNFESYKIRNASGEFLINTGEE